MAEIAMLEAQIKEDKAEYVATKNPLVRKRISDNEYQKQDLERRYARAQQQLIKLKRGLS